MAPNKARSGIRLTRHPAIDDFIDSLVAVGLCTTALVRTSGSPRGCRGGSQEARGSLQRSSATCTDGPSRPNQSLIHDARGRLFYRPASSPTVEPMPPARLRGMLAWRPAARAQAKRRQKTGKSRLYRTFLPVRAAFFQLWAAGVCRRSGHRQSSAR